MGIQPLRHGLAGMRYLLDRPARKTFPVPHVFFCDMMNASETAAGAYLPGRHTFLKNQEIP